MVKTAVVKRPDTISYTIDQCIIVHNDLLTIFSWTSGSRLRKSVAQPW